ncbi:hypothetical protein ACQ4PT_030756 [Festuca glaucescens]
MAHLLRSILYPSKGHPHHLTMPPKRFVADSILGGFDLNQQLHEDNCDVDAAVNGNDAFVPGPGSSSFVPGPESDAFVLGPESVASGNAAEEAADEISSQPDVPYAGMVFDDLEEAYKVYNDYAYKTGWNIEAQSQKFYTPEVFERFQKIILTSIRFHPIHVEAEILSLDLVPNIGLDIKTYRVEVVAAESLYSCACNSFEMCGLLCPHIIRVMVHLNIQEIPSRYLLHRWSAAATTTPPDPGANTIRFGVPTTNTLKYNALCRKMNNLASDACYAEDTYAIVSSMVDEACKVVTNMRRARNGLQQQADQLQEEIQPEQHEAQQPNNEAQHKAAVDEAHGSGNLQNPPRNKPKGRPKEIEKRHKPLVELRDEANEKRQKKASEPKSKKEPAAKVKRKARVKNVPIAMKKVT